MPIENTPIRRLIYTSQATVAMDAQNLKNILQDARAFNALDHISGVLLHDHGHFLQLLEGPPDAIEDLLAKLSKDTRHEQLEILLDTPASNRLFPDWRMGFGDLADPTLDFLPGMAGQDEQHNRLLTLMAKLPELAPRLHAALGRE